MAPCLRRWGSIRGPSRPQLAASDRNYRPARENQVHPPSRLPQKQTCFPSSTSMSPNDVLGNFTLAIANCERPAQRASSSPRHSSLTPVPRKFSGQTRRFCGGSNACAQLPRRRGQVSRFRRFASACGASDASFASAQNKRPRYRVAGPKSTVVDDRASSHGNSMPPASRQIRGDR
jgi:hypothetical protein